MNTPFDTLSFSDDELAKIVGGTVVRKSAAQHKALFTDSRIVTKGSIFLALRGENSDGHNFIGSAAEHGATCIIAERIAEEAMRSLPQSCAVILVPNTLYALGALGKWFKKRTEPAVVAVTGSVGKTTTKQMVYAALSKSIPTMRTEGNYNNEIGLPLTLMQIQETDRIAVLEAGMNHKDELHRLSLLCEPDITIITNIGTSHIENLGSREGIRDAKLEMLDGMKPGGLVILNGDEPLLTEKREEILSRGLTPVYIARDNPDAEYLAENIRMTPSDCTFDLTDTRTGTTVQNLRIPVTGEHNIGNAMAAFLCGRHFGIAEQDLRAGLLSFENTGMRQHIFRHDGYTVIEDCYNASPESMEAAIRVLIALAEESGGRAVAVLGEMRELGSFAPSLHKRVGSFAAEAGCAALYTFGSAADDIASGAVIAGMSPDTIFRFPDLDAPKAPAEALRAALRPGDAVLFKASRAVAMERIIEVLSRTSPAK